MAYWIVAAGLCLFGFLTGFSIGQPFLLVGVALVLLGPVRHRARIFVPILAAVVAYNLGFFLSVPFYCTATSLAGQVSLVVCKSLLGATFTGGEGYNPSPVPAIQSGLILATVAGTLSLGLLVAGTYRRRLR
jgi:hypothetical protein